ncbi:MAG: hypothetical protein JWN98_2216 [Abditibacteriota bacterium]|nr:hypothetical protein [Abditibacteriota bacterium]
MVGALLAGVLGTFGFNLLLVALTRGDQTAATVPTQSTLEDAPLASLRFDTQFRIVEANREFQHTFAFQNGDSLARLWHPDEWENDRLQLKSGTWQSVERRVFRADGSLVWAELSIERQSSRTTLWIRDVSRCKAAETELAQTRAAIHDLYEIVAGGESDLNTKLRSLLAMGCRRFGVETGFLGQVQDNHLKVLHVYSADDRIRSGQVYDVGGALADAAKLQQPVLIQPKGPRGLVQVNPQIDWQNYPLFTTTENETYLGAPVRVNGALYGTLNFSDPEPRAPFAPAETEFLQLMAQWLGSEIERRQTRVDLEKQQKQLLEVNQKLESLAVHDGLTGVKNRRAFDERLALEFRRSRRYGIPLSLILLDVDKFKHFNDTFGHPAGDEVLKRVASLLQSGVREIDFMARYGGEEFVILLPNTDAQGAQILAERLRASIEGASWKLREVTASFGISILVPGMQEPTHLTAAADAALYESKANGRNRVTVAGDKAPNDETV